MPNMSAYPPIQDVMPGAGAQPQAPQGQNKEQQAALLMQSPIVNALKVLGISIQGAVRNGNPNAQAMSSNFSGLLQSFAQPSLDKGAAMGQQAPAAPQAAPAQPQAAPPIPQAAPAPAPQAASAPAPVAQPQGMQKGLRPFGAPTAGQRPVSKQPVII